LAEFAGVNPALITYYFPTKEALIDEATTPVLKNYADRQIEIIEMTAPNKEKISRLIRLFLECNFVDSRIFDAYIETRSRIRAADGQNYFETLVETSTEFLSSIISDPAHDAMFIQTSLWGICREVARKYGLKHDATAALAPDAGSDLLVSSLAASGSEVFRLLTSGIRFHS
jgi:AcrR family transcriptional regulator